ncbi:hypothetical protein AA309_05385 [Microvirga vignae]|uniref:Uncharacterized protein n=1 Tax=Microvirga vignae TaxID=1225564 RepID=A0A0H1RFD8_9HYPH|nr:hypothetical protein [Microvirga vignae]KLK93918.1 hypothetical protein AA309_05385 [Microvirga vignae]
MTETDFSVHFHQQLDQERAGEHKNLSKPTLRRQRGPSHKEQTKHVHFPRLTMHFPTLAELHEVDLRPLAYTNRRLTKLIVQLRAAADFLEVLLALYKKYNDQ